MQRLILYAAVAIIFIATMLLAIQARNRIITHAEPDQPKNAFDSYMILLPDLIHKHQPYVNDAFPLPPFAMLFVAPFTYLSRPNAQMAWILCKPFLFIPIFFLALSMIRRSGATIGPLPLCLIGLAWFFPLVGDIQEGQMNLLMLLPLTLALWNAQSNSTRGDTFAGLLLAAAICIKVTPLAFLPYFLIRKRWRIVGFTCIGIVLWLFIAPSVVFGWDQNIAWLDQWSHIMILPYVLHSAVKYSGGESIPEVITRFLSHAPAWLSSDSTRRDVPHYVNFLDLPESMIHVISRMILLAAALCGLIWARRPLINFRSRRYVMEIGCVGAFMLLASERTWVHHYVTLLFALMAVGMIASDSAASFASRRRAWVVLVIVAAIFPFTSDLAKIFGPDGRHYIESFDLVLVAALLLVAVLMSSSYREELRSNSMPIDFCGNEGSRDLIAPAPQATGMPPAADGEAHVMRNRCGDGPPHLSQQSTAMF